MKGISFLPPHSQTQLKERAAHNWLLAGLKASTNRLMACSYQLSQPITQPCIASYHSRESQKAETAIDFWLAGQPHLSTFEFGGHTNLAGLSLLDIRASLDSPIYFLEWPTIEICCIFVPKSVQICLQSSKIRPPNSNVDKCDPPRKTQNLQQIQGS